MKLNLDAPQIDGHAELEQAVATLQARGLQPHKNGDGWIARCPAHDDKRQSLSLGVGKNGKLLLRCHANQGCGFERIRDELGINAAGARGDHPGNPVTSVTPAEPRKRNTVAKPTDGIPRGSKVTEAYAYTDEQGATLFLVLRLEPKSFRPRVPTGDGRWYTDLGDARRVLYDLPDVLATVAKNETIYVCEGEKACERVKQEGVVATTQGGAARQWTPELVAPLTGARVIIVADADEPGRDSARALAAVLEGVAESVQLVESATGIEKHGADDHLNAGHTLEDLAVLESPLPLSPFDLPDPEPEPEDDLPPGADGIQLLDLAHLLANPPPDPDYDWHGYLERGTLAVLHGDGGLGKSLIGMGLCRRYTLGKEWLGQSTPGGFALYLDGENSLAEIARRLYAFEVRGEERRLKYGRVDMPILLDPIMGDAILEHWIRKTGAELLVLDSQRALWGGDEREQLEVRPMYQMLAALAERLTVSILLIHHDNKSGLYSGSTDINAAVVSRLHLERYSTKNKKDRRRTLWHEKSRSGPEVDEVTFSVDKTTEGVLLFEIHDEESAPPHVDPRDELRLKILTMLGDRVPRTRPETARELGLDPTNGTLRRTWDELISKGSIISTDTRTFTLA